MIKKQTNSIQKKNNTEQLFSELLLIMSHLRGPEGCPWDKLQDHKSLIPYLFSEAKEVKEAVKKSDWENLQEELGDILLQVVFHSQIASENGLFSIDDVIDTLSRKLRRRHPHVFGNKKLKTSAEVKLQWEKIKTREKTTNIKTLKNKKP